MTGSLLVSKATGRWRASEGRRGCWQRPGRQRGDLPGSAASGLQPANLGISPLPPSSCGAYRRTGEDLGPRDARSQPRRARGRRPRSAAAPAAGAARSHTRSRGDCGPADARALGPGTSRSGGGDPAVARRATAPRPRGARRRPDRPARLRARRHAGRRRRVGPRARGRPRRQGTPGRPGRRGERHPGRRAQPVAGPAVRRVLRLRAARGRGRAAVRSAAGCPGTPHLG